MKDIKRKKWEKHVADFQLSKQSAPAWCKANHVNVHTLRYWIKKFKKENAPTLETKTETPTTWLKVDASDPKSEVHEESIVIHVGKASIEITPDFDAEFLKDVVRTLSAVC